VPCDPTVPSALAGTSQRAAVRLASVGAVLLSTVLACAADAAVYYVGAFTGATPTDDAQCGTGVGRAPAPHPCATLAYWTQNRRSVLTRGDVVRLTGTLGPSSNANHCILAAPGVTYEGRTAADAASTSYADAIIDASSTPDAFPCFAGGIRCVGCDLGNFTLRNLTITQARGTNGSGNILNPGATTASGLGISRVRFTANGSTGLIVGATDLSEDNPCQGHRNLQGLTVADSQFDGNAGSGLWIGCVDGASIQRVSAFDNRAPGRTYADCAASGGSLSGCDDYDGIHVGGLVNATIADVSVYRNGEDGIDVSGNGATRCDAAVHEVVIDRAVVYDSPKNNISINHCNYHITVRNSFVWGGGKGLECYECAHDAQIYDNTFWMNAGLVLRFWENCRRFDVRNNIFRGQGSDTAIVSDSASMTREQTWNNNLVINDGSGFAFDRNDGAGCQANATYGVACPGCPAGDPQSPCRSGDPCPSPHAPSDLPYDDTSSNGLVKFKKACASGVLFSGCDRDVWGVHPALRNATAPTAANLHLAPGDTVAVGGGVTLSPAFPDYDGDARPQGTRWDIGADELVDSAPAPPSLLSVEPVP